MRIILTLLFIGLSPIIANNLLETGSNKKLGSTIPFFEQDTVNCSKQEAEKKIQAPIITEKKEVKSKLHENMKTHLTTILHDVKEYKNRSEHENKELTNKLNALKKEFKQYKVQKKRELITINKKLHTTQDELLNKKKKLINIQKVVRKKEKKTILKKNTPKIVIPKIIKAKITTKKIATVTHSPIEEIVVYNETPLIINPIPKDTSWVEIVVQDEIDIYQLALLYYGDREKYKDIYVANQEVIGTNFQIYSGMSLKIPMTVLFEEQPMMLNTY